MVVIRSIVIGCLNINECDDICIILRNYFISFFLCNHINVIFLSRIINKDIYKMNYNIFSSENFIILTTISFFICCCSIFRRNNNIIETSHHNNKHSMLDSLWELCLILGRGMKMRLPYQFTRFSCIRDTGFVVNDNRFGRAHPNVLLTICVFFACFIFLSCVVWYLSRGSNTNAIAMVCYFFLFR